MPSSASRRCSPTGRTPPRIAGSTATGSAATRCAASVSSPSAPAALTRLAADAVRDVSHLFRPGHLAQLRKILDDPEASDNDRFVALDHAAQRLRVGGHDPAVLPGHRHGDRDRQEGPARLDGRRRRSGARARHLRHLHRDQPALLADGAALGVRRGEHGHEPARPDRALRDRRRRVPVPLRHQGRRLGEQDVPLPGDQGAPEPEALQKFLEREDEEARHGRLPAVPSGGRDRRHLGRDDAEDRQARELPLPRRPARPRATRTATPSAISSSRREILRLTQRLRHRRAVRRQVLLPRRARRSACRGTARAARSGIGVSCSADRQAKAKITRDGVFLEQLETNPAQYMPDVDEPTARRRRGEDRSPPPDERDPRRRSRATRSRRGSRSPGR